jgi:hypothetical protein
VRCDFNPTGETTNHAGNTRTKRAYFAYLRGPKRQREQSVDAAARALSRFEAYTRHKDFKTFRKEAIGFKAYLAEQVNQRTKERLSKATLFSTLAALKRSSSCFPVSQVTSPG